MTVYSYQFPGFIKEFSAPDFAPGGPDGPAYIVLAMGGVVNGIAYNPVFYILCDSESAAQNSSIMTTAFVNKKNVKVYFTTKNQWNDGEETGGLVQSIELA